MGDVSEEQAPRLKVRCQESGIVMFAGARIAGEGGLTRAAEVDDGYDDGGRSVI